MAAAVAQVIASDCLQGTQLELFGLKPKTATRMFTVQICSGVPPERAIAAAILNAVPKDASISPLPQPGESHPSFAELRCTHYDIVGMDTHTARVDAHYKNFSDFFISGNSGLSVIDWYLHIIDDAQVTVDGKGNVDSGLPGTQILVQHNPFQDGNPDHYTAIAGNIHRFVPEGTVTLEGYQTWNPVAAMGFVGCVNASKFMATRTFGGFDPGVCMLENITFDTEYSAAWAYWQVRYTFRIRVGAWYEFVFWKDKQNRPGVGLEPGVGIKKIAMAQPCEFTANPPVGLGLPRAFDV